MDIITNHRWRNLTYGYELTEKERSEFDWIDPVEIYTADFVRYRGRVIALNEFERAPESLSDWDGIHMDSYFSGVVIKLSRDGDQVICGLALS